MHLVTGSDRMVAMLIMKGGNRKLSLKKISLLLIVFMVFTIHSASANQRFTDVPSSHGAYEEINYLVNLGVIKGYPAEGKFKPNNSVTRGQAAKMVVEATGHEPLVVSKSSFTDIDLNKYPEVSGYAEAAVKLGFFREYSAGKFNPNEPLTRKEMSRVLTEAFKLEADKYANLSIPFTDISPKDPYYKYIAAIYYNGITKGNDTGTKYNASGSVTRAQFSSFIARASNEKYRLDLPVQGVTVPDESDAIAKVIVTTNDLNVRSSASSSNNSNVLGKVNTGAKLYVYERQSNGWLKVAYNGRYAYIYENYVDFLDENGKPLGKVEKEVVANDTTVTVYKKRDLNAEKTGSFKQGEKIKVYETLGNWYLTMDNGLPGYVRVKQTKEIVVEKPVEEVKPDVEEPVEEEKPEKEEPSVTTNTIGIATESNLHIRSEASGSSKSLGTISRGTEVSVHSVTGNWAKVTYKGINGYIHKTYLRLVNTSGKAVKNRVIVIDAGHGGKDPGASSNGGVEKQIVLKVAQKVQQKLVSDGAKVYMTRTGDTYPTLEDRVDFAFDHNAEVFVSIHVNSATSTQANGTETYYSVSGNANEAEDYRLASAINSQIVKNADMYNRGVKTADFYVIKNMILPSVLVELGFVTNSADREKLVSDKYVEIFADSIYKGIVQYYSK